MCRIAPLTYVSAMNEPTSARDLGQLKASDTNPRRISKKRLAMLTKSIGEFGDLGGVIFNRRTGNLVGGHQRVEAFRAVNGPSGAMHLTRTLETPSDKGTTAEGYIEAGGERFSYREVDWDENTERLANLAANKSAGYFDTAALADVLKGLDGAGMDLSLSMFDTDELAGYLPKAQVFEDAAATDPSDPAAEEPQASPERVRGPTPPPGPQRPADAPHAEPLEQPSIKQVSLYFREADHAKFVELVDALKDVYSRSNVSDVVLEAVKRASISAAFK